MGAPVRIIDLARKLIKLNSLTEKSLDNPNGDIEIQIKGLRPGEKLYEELLIGESVTGTEHPKILRAEEETLSWEVLQKLLSRLKMACDSIDLPSVRSVLLEAVDGFEPKEEVSDPLWASSTSQTNGNLDEPVGIETQVKNVTSLFKEH